MPACKNACPDARVEADAPGHLRNIRAHFFRQLSDFVDVADFERQEGVGGVLDQLGRSQVGGDQRHRAQAVRPRQVGRRRERSDRARGGTTCTALRQSAARLRRSPRGPDTGCRGCADPSRKNSGLDATAKQSRLPLRGFCTLAHHRSHPVATADRHGGFIHDHGEMRPQTFPHATCGGLQITQIRSAPLPRRRAHGNENHLGVRA